MPEVVTDYDPGQRCTPLPKAVGVLVKFWSTHESGKQ